MVAYALGVDCASSLEKGASYTSFDLFGVNEDDQFFHIWEARGRYTYDDMISIIEDFENKNADIPIVIENASTGVTILTNCASKFRNLKKASHCLLYTSPSPRDRTRSRMPSSA